MFRFFVLVIKLGSVCVVVLVFNVLMMVVMLCKFVLVSDIWGVCVWKLFLLLLLEICIRLLIRFGSVIKLLLLIMFKEGECIEMLGVVCVIVLLVIRMLIVFCGEGE